ncbi:cytochrome P450 2B4-like [Paramacrobiotus metropolitanus]|uniref:cytochrome P450 2B4-like n=1 Tax=Paramacrobiotus metropolitanus TaxID=2943436 RepID=UPI0024460C27|nr:cytochrome P450 2B4-like [Paramacrobiotus metropolitanus]
MIEFVIGGIVLLLGLIFFRSERRAVDNLPPGPPGLPVVGNLLQLGRTPPFKRFMEWRKTYGDTFLIHMGSRFPMVVMHDYDTIKKVLNDEVTTGRDQRFVFVKDFAGKGLIFTQGDLWKEQRRFAISTLRDFGMGKTWLEDNIIAEVEDMCGMLRKLNRQPFDPKTLLSHSVSNVICALVFGKRFDHSDAKFGKLSTLFAENIRVIGPVLAVVQAFPILRFVPGPFRRAVKVARRNFGDLYAFCKQLINEHQSKFSSESADDYIDAYLKEAQEQKRKGIVDSTFSEQQLIISVLNLFAAGTETTSTTTLWALVFLLENPDVMRKMQKEIDDNVPRDRSIRMEDKGLLPYTEAAILEIQRCASLVPLGVFHQTLADTVIDGYNVPKGTLLAANLYSVHHDPRYWKNPTSFDPNHFLDADGKVVHPAAGFAPFEVGKRSCLGEALAKMELHLFIANIVKDFSLENEPGKKVSHENFVSSFVLGPSPCKMVFVPR